jgi:hypothetical protein
MDVAAATAIATSDPVPDATNADLTSPVRFSIENTRRMKLRFGL